MAETVGTGQGSTVWRRATARRTSTRPSAWSSSTWTTSTSRRTSSKGSAAQIWACLDGERTEAELVSDLADAYEVPAEVVAGDVRQFIDRLAGLGLVVSDNRP